MSVDTNRCNGLKADGSRCGSTRMSDFAKASHLATREPWFCHRHKAPSRNGQEGIDMTATLSIGGVEYDVVDSTPGMEDGSLVLSLRPRKRVPLSARFAGSFGMDISRHICDALAEAIADLGHAALGDERDGVWEEGYGDALHDVLLAVGLDPEDVLLGRVTS